ncbi:ABC transporter substrate-binding protein [Shouchella sp. JSM 1781072]|uniref:ABC transporter substrate-binding protein n=1 Tax=Bacillaceae TaxID=186817 RepID=UPI000C07A230|nr:iron-siderophore ABC transporter substrate-binding protein [Bacillus sp. Marseille-P3800]
MKTASTLLSVVAIGLLAACGDSESSSEETNQTGEEGITVSDIHGEQTFETVPEKAVVLDWIFAENLLSFGIEPTGMAEIESYQEWVDIGSDGLSDTVDVGSRSEPNLEAIAQLEPDVIYAIDFRADAMMEELEKIAPVLVYNPYPEENLGLTQYDEMEETYIEMAKLFDKTDEANDVLADLEATYEEAEQALSEIDLETREFALTMAYSDNQAPAFRISTPNALAVEVLERMGLENVYDTGTFEPYGFSTVGVEEFTKVEDANLLHIVQGDDNVFENQLQDNSVWNDLTFTKEGRVYALGGDTWPYGGPLSAEKLVHRTLEVLDQ